MPVKVCKVKGGYATKHGGKMIHRFKTKRQARAQQRAIYANTKRKK